MKTFKFKNFKVSFGGGLIPGILFGIAIFKKETNIVFLCFEFDIYYSKK
jgi:hypothetical protein